MKCLVWMGLITGGAVAWGIAAPEPPSNAAPPSAQSDTSQDKAPADQGAFRLQAQPFLETYCMSCHQGDKAKAKYRLDDVNGNIAAGHDTVRWEKALEMISLGDMPPENAKLQPTDEERKEIIDWIGAELKKIGRGKIEAVLQHPSQANRVSHEALFSGEHTGPAYSPPRLWRISPAAYSELLSYDGSAATLDTVYGHGFKDYATLVADEATANTMLRTTGVIASFMVGEKVSMKRSRNPMGSRKSKLEEKPNKVLTAFYQNPKPTNQDYTKAALAGYQAVFERQPPEDEIQRYESLLRKTSQEAGHRVGVKTMLRAMMMSPQFIFRMELGLGEQLPDGRRMLSPMELAYAIGFAILDTGPDAELIQAAEEGRLTTKADVEREVRRLLAIEENPSNRLYQMSHRMWNFRPKKARLLRFFREFFGYAEAVDVFKDDTRRPKSHRPIRLVRDADQLVLYAIEQDKQVLEFLLTTDKYFTSYQGPTEDYFAWLEKQIELGRATPGQHKSRYRSAHISAYNLAHETWEYEPVQPFKQPVPRAGMLTHPAWLVAHSGNFDTDIVRRGKWVREHLLAEVVPELPIGVDAQLTTDTTLNQREKFAEKVYDDACWRCHKKMNPLGYPFEMYDDFGRHRSDFHYDQEGNIIGSPKQMEGFHKQAERAKKQGRDPSDYLPTTKPIDTTGSLDGTGDPALDGEVKDAVDLVHRLAKSNRARQSFVRHAFRYWMGRNETLNDSPTLIAADKAYVESDGSFNELLVSLLTSDSFLYRKDAE